MDFMVSQQHNFLSLVTKYDFSMLILYWMYKKYLIVLHNPTENVWAY